VLPANVAATQISLFSSSLSLPSLRLETQQPHQYHHKPMTPSTPPPVRPSKAMSTLPYGNATNAKHIFFPKPSIVARSVACHQISICRRSLLNPNPYPLHGLTPPTPSAPSSPP